MSNLRLCILVFACCASSMSDAQEIPAQQAFVSLLKQGYEIKATSIVPLVEHRQFPNTAGSTHSPLLITMQKGQSVAVCTINWNNWSNMQKASLEDPKLCDVR
jgi:hypothetical protein